MKRAKGTQNIDSASRVPSVSEQISKRESAEIVPKLQEHDDNEGSFECERCSKKFGNESQFYTHIRQKHPQQDMQNRNKQKKKTDMKKIESQQNDIEDSIYAFLGQLGQLHGEAPDRNHSVIPNDDNKITGHSNYCQNKVVRTPYEQQMKVQDSMPDEFIQKSQHRDLLTILKKQTIVLAQKIEEQRQTWQFRDPMDPQSLTDKQFSLMDIRKLIKNLPDKNLNITRPHFSVFVLWVSRICKPPAWKQFFILLGTLIALFQKQKATKDSKIMQRSGGFNLQIVCNRSIQNNCSKVLIICNDKQGPAILEHYTNWVQAFELVPQQ